MGRGKKKRKEKRSKQYSELRHHKQAGKVLTPPLLALPSLQFSSWIEDRLPDMLWCALLLAHVPRDRALNVFRGVGKLLEGKFEPGDANIELPAMDVGHTGLAKLAPDVSAAIIMLVCSAPGAKQVLRPLLLFDQLPLRDVWAARIGEEPREGDWDPARIAVAQVFDHQSQAATDCRWLRILVFVMSGQLILPSREMIREILLYPNEGDQRRVRPTIRAAEISFAREPGAPKRAWPEAFWSQCWRDTACIPYEPSYTNVQLAGTTLEHVNVLARQLSKHFQETITGTAVDAKHEAVFGLGAYALSILRELLRIGNGTGILGRLALRALLEVHVTLSYLASADSDQLWNAYRDYGSGQAKLAFLKIDDDDVQPVGFVNAEALSAIANEDRGQDFVPINLGSWDGTNLRQLSEKASVKPAYDRYYPWTSAYMHANWGALRSVNFDLCVNALHRAHRLLRPTPLSLNDVVADAVGLADSILESVDRMYPGFSGRASGTNATP